jgi:hypothetical protein
VIARNPNPILVKKTLPEDIQQALADPLPANRVQVVLRLKSLLYSKDAGLALAAEEALTELLNDDSNTVINMARFALEEFYKTKPPKEKTPEIERVIPNTGAANTSPKRPEDSPPPKIASPEIVKPNGSLLPQKLAEINQIIAYLGSARPNLGAARDQLSSWRAATAIVIRNEYGLPAALSFGAINAPGTNAGDLQRLRSIAEQCRQALLIFLK